LVALPENPRRFAVQRPSQTCEPPQSESQHDCGGHMMPRPGAANGVVAEETASEIAF